MKYFTPVLVLLLINSIATAQKIKIRVENLKEDQAAVHSLAGETTSFVDTLSVVNQKTFQFNLNQKHLGFYRLSLNINSNIDFINDNENVDIVIDANNIIDSMKIFKSESNKIYYEFLKLNKDYKTKTELLQLILSEYPHQDDYYRATKEKLIQVQEEYMYFVNVTAQAKPISFVARYVRSAQLPVIDPDIPFDEQLIYLKIHSLNNVNFYDNGLIYSDVFTNKTIEYLTYYRNPQLPLELLEKEFMSAVDTILNKAKVNEIVYTHITEYLLDGFKQFGFDNVLNYIVENYVIKDELCLNQKLTTALDRRIQQSINFKVGNAVPNIIMPDTTGTEVELSKINTDQILIIFYASWCPHCQTLLPKVYDLYKNQEEKIVEVLAFSIDTSRTDWLNFIRTNKLNWLNASDLKGWNGQAASDIYLYATPTIFLLNKEKEILLSSPTLNELKDWFNSLLSSGQK